MLETVYDGPVTDCALVIGGEPLRLIRPSEPDRLLDDPDVARWNRRIDYMPYWAYLWPGAFLLAEVVAASRWTRDTDALELGCGLGLAGLVGVRGGLRVCFSDYDQAPLRFVDRSAAANGFDSSRYSTRVLDWSEPAEAAWPLILGADVLYERRLIPLVVSVLQPMLASDGEAWLAGPDRFPNTGLEARLADAGMACEAKPCEARDDLGRLLRGTWHRIWKRA